VRASSKFHELYFKENLDAERALIQCLNQITVHETLDEFMTKLEKEVTENSIGPFTTSFAHLNQWMGSDDSKMHLEYMQLYECILTFEMNRPYQYWYVQAERLEISDPLVARLEKLGQEAAAIGAINFRAGIEAYLKEARSGAAPKP